MKTFSTSGTGNQQTLSEIESDKMPVYENLEAVENDLSNLEEGQLGLTKDTGNELAQPVDAVESGNLHAVTSNAVAESLSYSTEEVATGGKWIDGKPIYRIVFHSATNWADGTKIGTISNLDYVISIKNLPISDTNYCYENYGTNGNYISLATVKTNGEVYINRGSSFSNSKPSSVIIEYTKTTD